MTTAARFMQKVDKGADNADCCWIWNGSKSGSGYGQFWNGKRTIPAHWFLVVDFMPEGKEACHKCDNKLCVRPSHIFIGSRSDNMRDCVSKGRLCPHNGCMAMLKVRIVHKGSKNHQAKLLEENVQIVKAIRPRYGLGRAIAASLGVSETVISGIWKGRRWRHVEPGATAAVRAEAFLKTVGLWKEDET